MSSFYLKTIDRILSSSRLDINHILSQLENDSSRLPPTQTNQPNSLTAVSCPCAIFEWGLPSLSYPFSFLYTRQVISLQTCLRAYFCPSARFDITCPTAKLLWKIAQVVCCMLCMPGNGCVVDAIRERASKPPVRLDRSFMTHNQILQKMGSIEKNLKKEKLAVCSYFCCPSKSF